MLPISISAMASRSIAKPIGSQWKLPPNRNSSAPASFQNTKGLSVAAFNSRVTIVLAVLELVPQLP